MSAVKKRSTINLNPLDSLTSVAVVKKTRKRTASDGVGNESVVNLNVALKPKAQPKPKAESKPKVDAKPKAEPKPKVDAKPKSVNFSTPGTVEDASSVHTGESTPQPIPASTSGVDRKTKRYSVSTYSGETLQTYPILREASSGAWGYYDDEGFVSLMGFQGAVLNKRLDGGFLPLAVVAGLLGGVLGLAAIAVLSGRRKHICRVQLASQKEIYVLLDQKSLIFLKTIVSKV